MVNPSYPLSSIAARHGVNPNQVSKWKTEAHDGLLDVFARGGVNTPNRETEQLVERLYARIGELTVERDFFRGVWSASADREGEADPGGRHPGADPQVRTGGGEPLVAVLRAEDGARAAALSRDRIGHEHRKKGTCGINTRAMDQHESNP